MPISRKEFERRSAAFDDLYERLKSGLDEYEARFVRPPLVTDWEDVEQRTNVASWCEACQTHHWAGQCDPDLDEQRMPR